MDPGAGLDSPARAALFLPHILPVFSLVHLRSRRTDALAGQLPPRLRRPADQTRPGATAKAEGCKAEYTAAFMTRR
jgi:hypothetical protein